MTAHTTPDSARLILGPRYHSFAEVQRHFLVAYTDAQRERLAAIPFGEASLRACRGTHLLVPGTPLSLLDVRDRHAALFSPYQRSNWYDDEAFACSRRIQPRWLLLRSTPVPGSNAKAFEKQCAMLSPEEEVPGANPLVSAMIVHYLATGEWILQNMWVRCRDEISTGIHRVVVGCFRGRLHIDYVTDGARCSYTSLASCRKS